ncbi:hypothetical protein JL720_11332 [Aureococcus anophagefferens]|nr:hypothetical protein JL720_11332 [Aureococcus anophagefferens]
MATGMVMPASIQQMGLTVVGTEDLGPKYEVVGHDMQLLRIQMEPGDKVVAEPGAMVYMHSDVQAGCDSSDCMGRCCSGSPCIMGTFETPDTGGYLGLTPVNPAKVIPLELGGRSFLGKDGAYFASIGDVTVGYDCDCNPATCCCGGQGLVRQKISGNGMAFLGAMGVLTTKTLAEGETFVVDSNSLVAWEETVKFSIKRTGGCLTCCCSGEGMFNTTLEGPGTIFTQSYSHAKFKTFAINQALLGTKASSVMGANESPLAAMAGGVLGEVLGAPPAAEGIPATVLMASAQPVSLDDVRRRGLVMASAAAPIEASSMDRKLV